MRRENLRPRRIKREVIRYILLEERIKYFIIGAMVIVDQIKQRETMRIREKEL